METNGAPETHLAPESRSTVKEITETVVETAMTKGAMGLTQTFANIGNASAMVILVGVFIASLFYVSSLHSQGMVTFQQLHQEGLTFMKAMVDRQEKQMDTQELRHMTERVQTLDVIKQNSAAIDRLAEEVKLSRIQRVSEKKE